VNTTSTEARRLDALRRYDVLDTPPDPALDDLATLAAHICDAPISLISLVDEQRQWFKSHVGWDVAETHREVSFCAHALNHHDLLIIPDTTADERFAANPLVTSTPRIRFYAGATLRTPDGEPLGTLCVMDRVPRQLTDLQLQTLRVLSRQVMAQLELNRRSRELVTGLTRDIADRAHTEAHIRHLNRVYAVLSDINQTIVREKDPEIVLAAACRIAVEKGGFRMAWIGLIDPDSGTVVVRAHAGADAGTLRVLDAVIQAEPPAGCVFTHRALLVGQHGVCDDIAQDPRTALWRDAALERGYLAMAAFPLKTGDRVIGTFNIYAGEKGFFDAEEVQLLVGLADDISFALDVHARALEHQRAEEQRRVAEERFRQLAENIQQVFWMTDARTRELLYVSPAYETIWGRPTQELYSLPHSWRDSIHPDDRARVTISAEIRQVAGQYDEVYRITRPDGSIRWIRDRAFPIRHAEGYIHRIVGTATDVTEQVHLQEQFLQAQKMESVGRLAGGIAHDFNNLLTVINGTADLVMANLDSIDPLRGELEQIRQAGDRAATLTGQLLALSRRQILQPEILNLSEVVDGLRGMLRRLIGEDIQLVFRLSAQLARVRVDPGQIEQVLLNLAVNAQDAMPDGGTLLIETHEVMLDAASAAAHPATMPGPHVMLAVSDTGIGMDEATRQRIFEPFFTTKDQGKGTGLGLSTVYGIVEQSNGTIWVYSEPGKGTTFKIYLPCLDQAPQQAAARGETRTGTHGHETILLVEDEQAVRSLTKRILESAGYTVLQASCGSEALALLDQHRGPIDLLLTDVVMPGMNGRELATRIAGVRLRMKVLYTSGYTDDAILRHGVLDDTSRFISKPYTPVELTRRVRDVLDA
jgi:two-component system cell cycle sensor histidine kinase/response regulator CckA